MKTRLLKIANWLRLLDEDGLLSISNIAVIIVVVKVTFGGDLSGTDAAALLTVIGGYQFKRWFLRSKKSVDETNIVTLTEAINAIGAAVKATDNRLSRLELVSGLKDVQDGRENS